MLVAEQSSYQAVFNARFKGGYITRHYGNPDAGIHTIQLELAQRAYMHEQTLVYDREKAEKLRATLKAMLDAYQEAASK
jgi:N-formylglutamate amidohydrolase